MEYVNDNQLMGLLEETVSISDINSVYSTLNYAVVLNIVHCKYCSFNKKQHCTKHDCDICNIDFCSFGQIGFEEKEA